MREISRHVFFFKWQYVHLFATNAISGRCPGYFEDTRMSANSRLSRHRLKVGLIGIRTISGNIDDEQRERWKWGKNRGAKFAREENTLVHRTICRGGGKGSDLEFFRGCERTTGLFFFLPRPNWRRRRLSAACAPARISWHAAREFNAARFQRGVDFPDGADRIPRRRVIKQSRTIVERPPSGSADSSLTHFTEISLLSLARFTIELA